MCYEKCTLEELLGFCDQRGIVRYHPDQYKGDLRLALENADEEFVFERLFDLPAELRVRIYEPQMQWLPPVGAEVRPPPITRVSKQLRHATLPPFYAERDLCMPLNMMCNYIRDPVQSVDYRYGIDPFDTTEMKQKAIAYTQLTSRNFLEKAPMKIMLMVKNFSFRGEFSVRQFRSIQIVGLLALQVTDDVSIGWSIRINYETSKIQTDSFQIHGETV